MLSFNSDITSYLERHSSNSIFLVRLYYGDESSFTGISSIDFTDGSDFYRGIASSIGPIQDDLDLFGFKVDQGNITINVVNAKAFDDTTKDLVILLVQILTMVEKLRYMLYQI